ncbi:MAG: tetratricopeptide repeat protein [Desulfobacteraceae bacterium]|nr:tetratricopeptide repeat protein [Desulfobacteraceae bacterium]
MLIATIYEIQKKYDESEKHYQEALKVKPDFGPAANNLAYIMVERGKDLDIALKYAQIAKSKMPDDPSVMDTLGWVLYKKGRYPSAIQEFKESVEKMPENAVARYHLGLAYYQNQQKALAKEQLEKALSLNSKFDGAEEAKKILSQL